MVAPLSIFSRNSAVLARRSASERAFIFSSRALMASTRGFILRMVRSCEVPNTFLMAQVSIVYLVEDSAVFVRGPARFRGGREHGFDRRNVALPGAPRNVGGGPEVSRPAPAEGAVLGRAQPSRF